MSKAAEQSHQEAEHISESHLSRLEKLKAWQAKGVNPYGATRYDVTAHAAELQDQYKDLPDGEVTEHNVHVAGRVMSNRNSGMFMDLLDHSGKIQIFSHKDHLDDPTQETLKLFDIGDIIGVEGIVRRTPRGELTINARTITLLAKSLQPLPEKYHGLSDVEIRYRKRHIDMTVNEESRETFKKRSRIITSIRHTVENLGFMEVETPMLHPIAGGANAKPFVTHHNTLDIELFLRIAPELYLKKLVVGGVSNKVYEINRCFRNEGISTRHNPEFTSIETYQAYANVDDAIALAEQIVVNACKAANNGATKVSYSGVEIDFTAPWPRKSMLGLIKEKTGLDLMAVHEAADARKAAESIGMKIDPKASWGKVVEEVFAEKIEPELIQPVHIIDFPTEISPLAKANPNDARITERFESYANGWEIANGFSELNDPFDQYNRFKTQSAARDGGDEEAQMMDESFIEALEFGLPPTAGLGVGIDRVTMLLTDSPSIRDVIAFPTLRHAAASSLVKALDEHNK